MTDHLVYPDGDYAIVEILGHRTIIGRFREVESFGTRLLAIEPIWKNALLDPVLIGGGAIYQLTQCSAAVAFARQPKFSHELPRSIEQTLPESNTLEPPDFFGVPLRAVDDEAGER